MHDDDALLSRAAAGDGEAFARLVAPHRAELLRFAGRMLGAGRQDGEEVLQDAMVNAYRALAAGAKPDDLRPWLFAIVRNCALNHRRRSDRGGLLDSHLRPPERSTPSEAAEQGEWIDWLMDAIAGLPERQREALVGRELEGRSHVELAASLGVSVVAVKTLLHRARSRLRRLRAESMLAVPLLVKGRAAGAKAGAGALGQTFAAASLTSLVVLAIHAPGVGQGHAGVPPRRTSVSSEHRHAVAVAHARKRALSRRRVKREARRAISRCVHGRSLRGVSRPALRYAAGHLSATDMEYTECERVLRNAALRVGARHARTHGHRGPGQRRHASHRAR